jgi:DNA primase
MSNLDRDSLPPPAAYLAAHGMLKTAARGEWATVCCPVHKGGNETHPSLRVSLVDGHFRCMACGASGGDLIALHRLVTGLPFRAAVHDLGGCFHD